jgi:hypothetical protein
MIVALEALSLVERAEPVHVCYTLHLRDKNSKQMQDGCNVYMDSYMTSYKSCLWSLGIFQKPSFEGRSNTKPERYGTPKSHNRWWFIMSYHICKPPHEQILWNSIWLRARSHRTFTPHLRARVHSTWSRKCLGTAFGHFLLDPHNPMVTATGLCVKWL